MAILASGLVDSNIIPGDTADDMYVRNNGGPTNAERLKVEMESLGMQSEIIYYPLEEDIINNLENGKVMLVSVNSDTIFTSGSHIMAIVDINTEGQIYICNPSTSTNDGWFDISEIMSGCNYIVVTKSISSITPISRSTATTGYSAVVARWTQVDTSLKTTDPNVEEYGYSEYNMTTVSINYQQMVEKYSMPFDFLWALLVVGEEKEFVFELANLVFESDIQITIYDDLTVNTDVDDWSYKQQTKELVDYDITAYCLGESSNRNGKNHEYIETIDSPYKTIKTVKTQTNTINAILTRANTWIVDYKNDYTYDEPDITTSTDTVIYDDQDYPQEPDSTGTSFSCEHMKQYKSEVYSEVIKKVVDKIQVSDIDIQYIVSLDEKYLVKYYNRYINISDTITNTIENKKYIKGTPEVREKTNDDVDKNDEPQELNFVTIFKKSEHEQNRKNIISVPNWLFEIIEENGKPDLDLVKYLLYKVTGKSYGVTEYNFNEYDSSQFSMIGDMYGDTFAEKVWWAFIDAGYSEYATAGAMGNFHCESGFIACRVQGDYSSGYTESKEYTEKVDSGQISREEFIHNGPRRWTVMDYVNGHITQGKQGYTIWLNKKE